MPGFVHIYTGDGKGKTTAAMGLALRAVGQGLNVAVVQFMKSRPSGEVSAAERLAPDMEIHLAGSGSWVAPFRPSPSDISAAREGLELAASLVQNPKYGLVVLDEVCLAVAWKLLDADDVIELVRSRSANVELVLTGRQADDRLLEVADYVTCMQCLKHPHKEGGEARKGIEY